MPASPLTSQQKADAKRLFTLFKAWQEARKDAREPYSQAFAASELGFNQSALSQYVKGQIPLNPKAAVGFARLLRCQVSDFSPSLAAEIAGLANHLSGESLSTDILARPIAKLDENTEAAHLRRPMAAPVVGIVQGGDNGFLEEFGYPVGNGEGMVPYYGRDPHAYALRVRGDSMADRIMSGDRIVVEPSTPPQPGDIAVVILKDGRKTVKKLLYVRDGEVTLAAFNKDHPQMLLLADDIREMHKVVNIIPR